MTDNNPWWAKYAVWIMLIAGIIGAILSITAVTLGT